MNGAIDFAYEHEEESIGGVPCERVRAVAPQRDVARAEGVILHFHGGMYCLGTPEIDRVLNAPLSQLTGLDVISVDYRLAPEHPFPAAIDDAIAVWRSLADSGHHLIVIGESAGGGLAAAAVVRASELGLPAARAAVLISPMLDLTGGSDTYATLANVDPDYGTDPEILLAPGRAYAGDTPLTHPLISPINADLSALPPTLIHVGNREVLCGDAARFAHLARRAGVEVTLQVLDGGWHNSPIWYGVPEADAALTDIADFIGVHA